ncbi:MAG: conjugal transfer protein TraF [Cellvibrionaceae bacterium]|nr:conjugal transfer protein TraF [Cellvibrionaceae bacterium]
MQAIVRALLAILYTCAVATSVAAQSVDGHSRWVDRKAEGWFWYKSEPLPEEQETPPEKPPEPVAVVAKPTEPQQAPGPAPFSAAWIRENIQTYLDAAIDNPTVENVSAYLYIQRYAMDKSTAFADASQEVTLGHAVFDEINRRPLAGFAKNVIDQQASDKHNDVLNKISGLAGIFFFIDTSKASEAQTPIIDILIRNFNFGVIKVAADNHPALLAQAGIKRNSGHREQMGVTNLPAVVLVRSDGVYDIASQATISYTELQKRLLLSAKRLNIISDAEYNSTRPLTNIENSLAGHVFGEDPAQADVPIPASHIINHFSGAPAHE